MDDFNTNLIAEFRGNDGKVGGMFADRDMILLTTTGAKSGQARTTPLVYTMDGDRFVILASYGGSEQHPSWYFNLQANPRASAEVGSASFAVDAEILEGAERDRVFNQMAATLPAFADYQTNMKRVIPAILLSRTE